MIFPIFRSGDWSLSPKLVEYYYSASTKCIYKASYFVNSVVNIKENTLRLFRDTVKRLDSGSAML